MLQNTPEDVDRSADMLLLFYPAGPTMLGVLLGAMLSMFHGSRAEIAPSVAKVLFGALVGGTFGLVLSLVLFRFRAILRWEKPSIRDLK